MERDRGLAADGARLDGLALRVRRSGIQGSPARAWRLALRIACLVPDLDLVLNCVFFLKTEICQGGVAARRQAACCQEELVLAALVPGSGLRKIRAADESLAD